MSIFQGGDYPAPSAFDSIIWLGVQPAVKEMFIKLLKTIEHQSSEMNRLDQQFKSFLSERDGSVRIMMDKVADSYSCINTKADKKHVAGLRRELLEVRKDYATFKIDFCYISLFIDLFRVLHDRQLSIDSHFHSH